MTTRAYDKMYLDKAQTALAVMLDYAVNDLKYDIDTFFGMFIKSGIAGSFEVGNPKFVVGMSGVELAWDTLYRLNMWNDDLTKPSYNLDRSPEYWVGWALAYFHESPDHFSHFPELRGARGCRLRAWYTGTTDFHTSCQKSEDWHRRKPPVFSCRAWRRRRRDLW